MKAIKITCLLLWSILCIRAEEQDSCVHLKEITVTGLTGSTHIKQIPSPISIINPEFLKTHQYHRYYCQTTRYISNNDR